MTQNYFLFKSKAIIYFYRHISSSIPFGDNEMWSFHQNNEIDCTEMVRLIFESNFSMRKKGNIQLIERIKDHFQNFSTKTIFLRIKICAIIFWYLMQT